MKLGTFKPIAFFTIVLATILLGALPARAKSQSPFKKLRESVPAAFHQAQGPATDKKTVVPRAPVSKTDAGAATSVLVDADEDYKIGSGDVIEVEIEDAPELSGTFRVNARGTFLMHYLGRITAKDRTTEDLARVIHDGLNKRYIYDPRVTVTVKQYNSRSFFIQGAVQTAGVYQIEGRPTLLELVTLAGGLQPTHGSTAFIIRKVKPREAEPTAQEAVSKETDRRKATSTEVTARQDAAQADSDDPVAQYTLQKVNVNGLLKGRFEQNMFLEPGDIVNIPQSEVFFVAGDVKSPGSFPLKEGTTLRQALSLAQGLNFTAANRGSIFRENLATGNRQEIAINFADVMKGKQEDLAIYPNDIIVVPNSRLKKATAPILSAFAVNSVLLPMRF